EHQRPFFGLPHPHRDAALQGWVVTAVADFCFSGPEVVSIHHMYRAAQAGDQRLVHRDVGLALDLSFTGEGEREAATLETRNVLQHDGGPDGDEPIFAGCTQLAGACWAELDGGFAAQ